MPKAFDACVAGGGKVRTVTLPKSRYVHVCKPKGGGKSVYGYVKTKKSAKGRGLSKPDRPRPREQARPEPEAAKRQR